jgi:hypothetical protein
MARQRKRKAPRIIEQLETPTLAQLANDDFDRDFVTHTETNTKAMAYRRRDSCIVEKWCRQGEVGFGHGAQRIIANCQLFWLRLGEPRLIAQYGERLPASTAGDGWTRQEALDELHRYKKMLGPAMQPWWEVFENVVRHNEPAGVAGSRFAKNDPQRIQSAKVITGFVASFIAGQLGY